MEGGFILVLHHGGEDVAAGAMSMAMGGGSPACDIRKQESSDGSRQAYNFQSLGLSSYINQLFPSS